MNSGEGPSGGYQSLTIRSLSRLEPIREAWLELWRSHGGANPFIHPSWVTAWLRHLGGSVRPLIITVWSGDSLAGLAALGIDRFGPWKRVVMLGSPMADYPDLLMDPGQNDIIGLLTTSLLKESWNWLDFIDVSEKSPHLNGLHDSLIVSGLSPVLSDSSNCPGVSITTDWDGYWTQKKSKTRYTINKKARRLGEEHGPLKLEVLEGTSEVREGLDEAAKVHAARWARQHTRTIFSEQEGRDFFDEALTGLCPEGIVRLYLLRAGSSLTAFSLSFVGQGVHYYYIPGFDQTFSKDSPGHLLLREIIRESHDQGLELFDFMKGDEDYKFRWANTHHSTKRLLVPRSDPWSRTGFRARRSYFQFRDRARQNPYSRKLFFAVMNPLARLRKSRGR